MTSFMSISMLLLLLQPLPLIRCIDSNVPDFINAPLLFPWEEGTNWDLFGQAHFLDHDPNGYMFTDAPRIRLANDGHLSFGAIWSRSALPSSFLTKSSEWQMDALFSGRSFLHGSDDVAVLFATKESIAESLNDTTGMSGQNFDGFGVAVSVKYGSDPLKPDIILKSGISRPGNSSAATSQPVRCWAYSITDLISRRTRLIFQKQSSKINVKYISPCSQPVEVMLDLTKFLDVDKQLHIGAVVSAKHQSGRHLDLIMFEFSKMQEQNGVRNDTSAFLAKEYAIANPTGFVPSLANVGLTNSLLTAAGPLAEHLASPPPFAPSKARIDKNNLKHKLHAGFRTDMDSGKNDRAQKEHDGRRNEYYESKSEMSESDSSSFELRHVEENDYDDDDSSRSD